MTTRINNPKIKVHGTKGLKKVAIIASIIAALIFLGALYLVLTIFGGE